MSHMKFMCREPNMDSSGLSPLADLDSSSGGSEGTNHTISGYLPTPVTHPHHQGLYVNGTGIERRVSI